MDDDTRLALEARSGEPVAVAAFVRRTQPDVWRYCAHLVDPGSADDLTQDVYIRALAALSKFRGDSSVRTWLLTIARRTCADAIRSRQRRRALIDRLGQRERNRAPVLEASSTGQVDLDVVIAGLDDDRRAAFALTQILGLSYAEAADVCACPVGTIRSRVARAREDLAEALEEVADETG